MPASVFGVGLVERAVDTIIDHLRGTLNGFIDVVYGDELIPTINPVRIPVDRYYISEAIHPLQLPAVFVVADMSDHDLTAQNFAAQEHSVLVAAVAEDIEAQRMQRKVWRYAKALWLALHDQAIGDIKVLVRSIDYGPTLSMVTELAGQRAFRKDTILRCDVLHYEAFR